MLLKKCCCCGLEHRGGVISGYHAANGAQKIFFCESCFSNPYLFNEAKRDLSHILFKIKSYEVPNFFANKHNDIKDAVCVRYDKNSKRMLAIMESLYHGQKQLT